MCKFNTCVVLLLALSIMPTQAAQKPDSSKKQTTENLYLTAKEAYEMKQREDNALLFVDVRTPSELVFVGSPEMMDINIPFMTMDYQRWDEKKRGFKKVENKRFVSSINNAIKAKNLSKSSPVILLCRSGSRSAKAANILAGQGYTKVYTIVDGFEGDKAKSGENKGKRVVNGWKNSNLPWSYKLDKAQLMSLN